MTPECWAGVISCRLMAAAKTLWNTLHSKQHGRRNYGLVEGPSARPAVLSSMRRTCRRLFRGDSWPWQAARTRYKVCSLLLHVLSVSFRKTV